MSLADDIATVCSVLASSNPYTARAAYEALDRIEAAVTGPVELEQCIREAVDWAVHRSVRRPDRWLDEVNAAVEKILSAVRSQPVTGDDET